MLRVILFIATNLAILMVVSVVLSLFGIDGYLSEQGIDYTNLFIWCAAFGMIGSMVSLWMSKWMAKRAMGVKIINKETSNSEEAWLLETVRDLSERARIGMPEVGIFQSDQPNAFATGARRNNSLVAISSGMLNKFSKNEVRAVLGHEIGHVANGDMITLTLIQGVVNTFVFFFARIIGHTVDRVVFRSDQPGLGFFITTIFAEIVLAFLAAVIVCWFSRIREYRADEWGARLTRPEDMVAALERLRVDHEESQLNTEMVAFGIKNKSSQGLARLWSTHPPLEKRIEALNSLFI